MGRGRPLVINWQETEEELYEQYRREKDGRRKIRLHLLWQLRQGKSLTEATQVSGVEYRTAQRWLVHYRDGGVSNVLRRVPGHASQGQRPKLLRVQQKALQAKADTGAFRSIDEAVHWVVDRWGVVYTRSGLYKLLRRRHLKKKVPRRQSDQADPQRQENWKKKTSDTPFLPSG